MDSHTCDARKPGYEMRPPIGANSLPCLLPADHWEDHRNAAGKTWPNLSEATCHAPVPTDLTEGRSGDAAEPCFLAHGHDRWTDHANAYVTWRAERHRAVGRTELILALCDDLSAECVELLRPLLRLAELASPEATDAELLAEALVSLDGLFAGLDD